jgi:hypothetical protein
MKVSRSTFPIHNQRPRNTTRIDTSPTQPRGCTVSYIDIQQKQRTRRISRVQDNVPSFKHPERKRYSTRRIDRSGDIVPLSLKRAKRDLQQSHSTTSIQEKLSEPRDQYMLISLIWIIPVKLKTHVIIKMPLFWGNLHVK